MLFDIKTKDSAISFLMDVSDFSKNIVSECEDCEYDFGNVISSSIVKREFEDLIITSFHIVGSLDACKEIKRNVNHGLIAQYIF